MQNSFSLSFMNFKYNLDLRLLFTVFLYLTQFNDYVKKACSFEIYLLIPFPKGRRIEPDSAILFHRAKRYNISSKEKFHHWPTGHVLK